MKHSIPLKALALGITTCSREEPTGQPAEKLQASRLARAAVTNFVVLCKPPGENRFEALCYRLH